MGKHIIKDIEFVECPYCEKGKDNQFQMIHWTHLKKIHGKKIDDVLIEFPGIPTMTKKESDRRRIAAKKGTKESSKTHSKLKTIKCIHCKNEIQVKNNTSNTQACKECLEKGLENPDGKTKQVANINRQKTLRKKYGVNNAANIPGVTEKKIETCENKYGGVGFASDQLKEKTINTIKEKYGVDNIMKSNPGKKGYIKTCNKKYNVDNTVHLPEIAEKISKTKKEYFKTHDHHHKGKTYEEIMGQPRAAERIEELRVSGAIGQSLTPFISAPQLKLFELVKQIYPEAIMEYPIDIFCIDIAIEDLRIAIEYDGSYWHDKERDDYRDYVLKEKGWSTIRFEDYVPSKEELILEINKNIL
jgi:ribosomal protein S27E